MGKAKSKELNKYFLKLSNKLSEINQFETFPNPCVGAVLVYKNNISTSYTGKDGSPHAEYKLLKDRKNIYNSNLYTSLEPCCHKGKNPSCVDIILKKKIKNVYTNSKDFDYRVKGKTKIFLNKKNVKIFYKNNESNYSKIHNISSKAKIPYVVSKIALSGDGFSKHNKKKLFTGRHALKFAHLQRYKSDSILIGQKTFNDDNPKLDSRIEGIKKKIKIFSINQQLKINPQVLKNPCLRNSHIFHNCKDRERVRKLGKLFKLIRFDFNEDEVCHRILKIIYKLNCKKILIEGGIHTLESFLKAKLINELYVVKNKHFFKKHGLLNARRFINSLKIKPNEIISLEENTILKYKPRYVYRDNTKYR
jgi:diaminohydroxyphosphoribosylaminopyrimidine deaminase/5-amino-6-(5-phosphoribosylamino)uracil reductase